MQVHGRTCRAIGLRNFEFVYPSEQKKNPDKFDEPRIKGPIEVVKSYKQMHYDGEFSAPKQ